MAAGHGAAPAMPTLAKQVVRRSVVRHAHGREGSVHAQQRVHGQALQPIDDALARLQLLWTPAAASAAALQWRQEDEKPTTGCMHYQR